MRKTNKKMIALILVLILIASFIPFKVFAIIQGNFTVKSNGAWTIGNVTVESNVNGPSVNLAADAEITLSNFDPETMEARLDGDNNFTCTLTVTNGKTSLSTASADNLATGLELKVVAKNNDGQNPPPSSRTYNVNFGTASWTIGEVTVTATMTGKTINNSQAVALEDNDLITLTNFDSETMEVRIIESNSSNPFSTTLTVDINENVTTTKIANHPNNVGVPDNLDFVVQEKEQGGNGGQNPGGNVPQFDGNAYFVWVDSNDKICYHKFTGLQGRPEDPNEGYKINYINVSELTDQSTNNSAYVWGQENANWVLAADMEDEHGDVRTDLTKTYIFGTGVYNEDRRIEMGVQLDPTGAQNGANSICSNGNRKFRTTIYRDNYNAIEFSSNTNDYTYFPCFWDQTFFSSTVDISGTTKDRPAEYDTYLLESTIRFTKGQFSAPITAVEALDVNPNAVDIRIVDGTCTIKFNSNYYDNVIFKITAGGKDYFVKVNRLVLDIKDNFGPTTTNPCLIARIFYDTSKSYDDFEVVATVIYNNGNTETKVLTPEKLRYYDSDDHNREIQGNEYALNGGKGLYESQCYIEVDNRNLVGAYFTIVKKGSLTAEGDTYNGTFSGSGEGTYYDARTRDIVL